MFGNSVAYMMGLMSLANDKMTYSVSFSCLFSSKTKSGSVAMRVIRVAMQIC